MLARMSTDRETPSPRTARNWRGTKQKGPHMCGPFDYLAVEGAGVGSGTTGSVT